MTWCWPSGRRGDPHPSPLPQAGEGARPVPRCGRFEPGRRRFVASGSAGRPLPPRIAAMPASGFTTLPASAVATRGDRRLWLGYAGLCLLCWLLYAIAGRDADRGSWQVWETVYEATWNLAPPMLLGTLALPWVRWLQKRERPAPAR